MGVGDASWARTLERIETVCRFPIDGVVALAPYLFRFPQREMIDYFQSLADASPVPLYLYDLPVRTGVEIDLSTYEILAKHPNIRGAKVSGRIEIARELVKRFGDRFRVIVAEPKSLDVLLREGLHAHLDGIFAVAPAVGQADRVGCRQGRLGPGRIVSTQADRSARIAGRGTEPDGGLHRDDERPRNRR